MGDYKLGTRSATVNAKNAILIHGKIKCHIHIQRMPSLNDGHTSRTVTQCFLLCIILPLMVFISYFALLTFTAPYSGV